MIFWEIRIKQYFQIQDYALWEVIEYGNSWVPIPITAPESGPSTVLKMTVPSTTEEKISRFGGNDATKKTQKALLKQQLAILGVILSRGFINVKFLRSLPSEWDTHVVVWMNKPDFKTMGLDDLYNNFKIVEQKVKRTVAVNNDDKNLAFLTTTSPSSTNSINTANTGVSTGSSKVNTASAETSTAKMDPSGNIALLSMMARNSIRYTGRRLLLMEVVLLDMTNPRIEDALKRQLCNCGGWFFDWSDMAEDEVQANMALMAFTDSEVSNDKTCSKNCLQNYEALKKQYDDLLVKLDDTAFKAATYKRGLSILEAQVVKYKESEVLFSEEIALLKRSVGHKDYLMGLVKTELEKVKEEKEGVEFKLAKFEKSSKDLDRFGYQVRPTPLDLSYSGLEEFQQPEINWYGPRDSSNNSKENTDDLLTQKPKSVTETSSVVPTLKSNYQLNEKGFVDSGCSRHMSGNIAHLSDFKEFDGGFVTFGGGANGGRITGKEFKNHVMDEFCREKGIKREYSVARTPQQNGVAERKNRTLIEAARTMLADSKLPTTFWAEAVSTACYVQNRVLVVKPHNKTPYELFRVMQEGSKSNISSQEDQDCIFMPIWKDASYFEDVTPQSVDDVQLQDQDRNHDDCSFQDDVSSTPHTRIHKDHPIDHVIGDVQSSVQTRRMTTSYSELGFVSAIYEGKTHQGTCKHPLLAKVSYLKKNQREFLKLLVILLGWRAMQEELLQFKLQNVWVLCYEEVYVVSTSRIEDPDHPDKVYKVVKALYGLHQAPRAWYDTLATYLLSNGFKRGQIDQTLFIKSHQGHILLVQIYVEWQSTFGSTKKELCKSFEKLRG
ncbi:retrovirus-related pol polyprotein from transposon TNT 1-94 [Tanacetum coccineum]